MNKHLFFWRKQKLDTLKISLNRESVCAGDDCDSHRIELEFNVKAKIHDLVYTIKKIHYLAPISGGKATWVLMNHDKEIAVLAQQWENAKYFISDETLLSELTSKDNQIELFVKYRGQWPPEMIYNEIEKNNKKK